MHTSDQHTIGHCALSPSLDALRAGERLRLALATSLNEDGQEDGNWDPQEWRAGATRAKSSRLETFEYVMYGKVYHMEGDESTQDGQLYARLASTAQSIRATRPLQSLLFSFCALLCCHRLATSNFSVLPVRFYPALLPHIPLPPVPTRPTRRISAVRSCIWARELCRQPASRQPLRVNASSGPQSSPPSVSLPLSPPSLSPSLPLFSSLRSPRVLPASLNCASIMLRLATPRPRRARDCDQRSPLLSSPLLPSPPRLLTSLAC